MMTLNRRCVRMTLLLLGVVLLLTSSGMGSVKLYEDFDLVLEMDTCQVDFLSLSPESFLQVRKLLHRTIELVAPQIQNVNVISDF